MLPRTINRLHSRLASKEYWSFVWNSPFIKTCYSYYLIIGGNKYIYKYNFYKKKLNRRLKQLEQFSNCWYKYVY